jgi:dihydrofolate synthase/folylpolyglutamate synthase
VLADALIRLYARIPLGMRLGLEPMREACARLGHPERSFEAVHVAGTNGKGSVCAMVESIARGAGRRTGLFTSPHLCRFAERILVAGQPLDDGALAATLERALDGGPDLSFFETATLAAFLAFRDAKVDLAVVEVGLGGRLDSTNVLPRPRAAAITRVALDHTDRLGATLVEIAREKAGIAKPGLDLVLGPMQPEVRAAIDAVAHAQGATTTPAVDVADAPERIGLDGDFQRDNAHIAAALGARIGASRGAIADGIATVRWPGRLERIARPAGARGGSAGSVVKAGSDASGGSERTVEGSDAFRAWLRTPRHGFLLDAAHNPDGAEALARHVRSLAIPPSEVALVFGTLGDKDWASMLDVVAPLAATRVYVAPQGGTRSSIDPAALAARHAGVVVGGGGGTGPAGAPLAETRLDRGPGEAPGEAQRGVTGTLENALRRAAASDPVTLVVVAGSLALVGEARALLLGLSRDPPVAL